MSYAVPVRICGGVACTRGGQPRDDGDPHCENKQAGCLDDIASVEKLDVVFVGPYDLSQSFGIPGQIYHPVMVEASEALAVAKRAGKPAVLSPPSRGEGENRTGFAYVAYNTDSLPSPALPEHREGRQG